MARWRKAAVLARRELAATKTRLGSAEQDAALYRKKHEEWTRGFVAVMQAAMASGLSLPTAEEEAAGRTIVVFVREIATGYRRARLALEMLRSDRDLRREEANDYSRAICFETTCLGCARLLEQMHALEDGPNGRNPWRDRAARWKAFAAKAWRENVAMVRGLQGAYDLNARAEGARYRAENAAGRWKALAKSYRDDARFAYWFAGENLSAAARLEGEANDARAEAERRGRHLVEARRELAAARFDYDRWAARKNAELRRRKRAWRAPLVDDLRYVGGLLRAARADAESARNGWAVERRELARAHALLKAPPARLDGGAPWHGLHAEVAELGRQFWWALGCCSFDPTDAESTAKYRAIADEARERLVALGYWVDGRRLSPEQVAAWRAGSAAGPGPQGGV
jgi:hypothetical protein